MMNVKIKTLAAIYSIFVGISMFGMWTVFYIQNAIPELSTEPIRTSMLITAEIVTALTLILGGYGLYSNQDWGFQTYQFSMGMLLYTLIVSPGYDAEKGNWTMVGMFAVLLILAIAFIGLSFKKPNEFR